jgi:hypothetical protein
MKKGLLLDRVDVHRDYFSVDEAVQSPVYILAYITDAPFAFFDVAMMGTKKTPGFLPVKLFIKHCLFHNPIIAAGEVISMTDEMKRRPGPHS